jgi:hypothetical protein
MGEMELPDAQLLPEQMKAEIIRLLGQGFILVQKGEIIPCHGKQKPTFSDRAKGFKAALLGRYDQHNGWRGDFDNRLLDDGSYWVHMRKPHSR